MEALSRFRDRIGEGLRWLPADARLASIPFLLAILLGLFFFAKQRTDRVYVPLLEGQSLSLQEIAHMMAAFRHEGLTEARAVGREIHVPHSQRDSYLIALDEGGALPAGFDTAIDHVMQNNSLLSSRLQTEESLQIANQKRLGQFISAMSGIREASVRYDKVKRPGFNSGTEFRALVVVRAVEDRLLEFEEIEAIRDTVTSYVAGLERKNVTVTDLNANRAYLGSEELAPGGISNHSLLLAKRTLEEEYTTKIKHRLSMYPKAVVAVNVHFAKEPESAISQARQSSSNTRGLTPDLVTTSIDLPRSSFRELREASLRLPTDLQHSEERLQIAMSAIEQAVQAILPPPSPPWQGTRQVVVTSYDDTPASTVEDITSLSPVRWEYLVIVGILLAIVGLWWIRRSWRRRAFARRLQSAAATVDNAESLAGSPLPASQAPSQQELSYETLRDELNHVITQNPEMAADVLKRWIGRAA